MKCQSPWEFLVKSSALTLLIASLSVQGAAAVQNCTTDGAWKRVRASHPIHSQTLAQCHDTVSGKTVIVLTEPPPHITRSNAERIIRSLFASSVSSVERRRHQLGFDGWVEDLVIVVDTKSDAGRALLADDYALLAKLAFGSAYKAEIENIDELMAPPLWQAPPAFEISKEELFTWLLGQNAQTLIPVDGGAAASLRERVSRGEFGTFHTSSPGMVVALVPRSSFGQLNDYIEDVRRFVLDSDVFLGAIKIGSSHVALIGRERSTSLSEMPPLRLETILLLASQRAAQLSQSYERRRAFAGKLLSNAGTLFGWDWAPILLSDAIIDTEFGSLLNFTDDMLKGWSESGKISYQGFKHDPPKHFPFGDVGAFKTIGGTRLVFNWNTAGVGFVSSVADVELFAVRNTGSLPVSYFPEGSEDNESAKKRLTNAEDTAYNYFNSLRNPLLQRAVQYASLYQVFLAFDVRASSPHDPAPSSASFRTVEEILAQHVNRALNELSNPSVPNNKELLLDLAFIEKGPAVAQQFESVPVSERFQTELNAARSEFSGKIANFDLQQPGWRNTFAQMLAGGYPIPTKLKDQLEDMANLGLLMVHTPESVRSDVVRLSDRTPGGWIRTPSIVVSQDEGHRVVGGHNIGGRATRVETDVTVPKGSAKVTGTYEDGRVIRINPADKDAEREVVRTFDREVGADNRNIIKGTRAIEAKLKEAPIVARPARVMANALEVSPVRQVRGAMPNPKAAQVGYRPGASFGQEINGVLHNTGADIVIAPQGRGFLVVRPRPAPPSAISAPNATSMHEAVNLAVRQVSLGPPTMLNPKVAFHGMGRSDAVRHVQSLAQRGRAIADGGGKPPFGGNRDFYAFADKPEPNRGFDYSLVDRGEPLLKQVSASERFWDAISSVFKKRRQTIHGTAPLAKAEMAVKPQWAAAEIRFPAIEDVQIIGLHAHSGHMHVVEVTVPVAIDFTKPQTLFLRGVSWFREKPTIAKTQEMNASIENVFKHQEAIDVEEALVRYKTMMIDQYGSDGVQINLRREGSDIIVVERSAESGEAARG